MLLAALGVPLAAARSGGLTTTRFALPGSPVAVAAGHGRIWVVVETNPMRAELVGLDPATGRREAALAIGRTGPDMGAVTSGPGAVWAAAGEHVLGVDPARPGRVERASLPGEAAAIAGGYGSVWVATVTPGYAVLRLDPATLAVQARIPLTFQPVALRAALGSMWVASPSGLWRITPQGNRLVPARDPIPQPVGLDVRAGRLWVGGQTETADAVDRAGRVRARVRLPFSPGAFAAASTGLWLTDNCGCRSGRLALVGYDGSPVAGETIGRTPVAVAASGVDAWVATFGDETVSRITMS